MSEKEEEDIINEELSEIEVEEQEASKKKINWNADKIMSTAALFISVISLIALLYQSYLSREENKLIQKQQSANVLPYLNQWVSEYENNYRIVMGNKGVGPAFITKVEIVMDSTKTFRNSDDLFHELFLSNKALDTIPYVTSSLIKGFVLPANETIYLLEVSGTKNIQLVKNLIEEKEITFSITYKDVYGTTWILSNRESAENSANVPVLISE